MKTRLGHDSRLTTSQPALLQPHGSLLRFALEPKQFLRHLKRIYKPKVDLTAICDSALCLD